jgi:hypothetical protein
MICRNMSVFFVFLCWPVFGDIGVSFGVCAGLSFMCIRDRHEVVAEQEDGLGRKR